MAFGQMDIEKLYPPFLISKNLEITSKYVPTDDKIRSLGIPLASRCSLCLNDQESIQHLLLECPIVVRLWDSIAYTFKYQYQNNFVHMLKNAEKDSPELKQAWTLSVWIIIDKL